MPGNAFSDLWYRVADSRVALAPAVQAQPQRCRGQLWFVLEDPYTQRFFRITPQAWDFLQALNPAQTVDEVWQAYARRHGEQAPGQDEVVRLLSQLHLGNMLYFSGQAHNAAIGERAQLQRDRELSGKLMSFLFWRVPLFNPNGLLDRLRPLVMACTGRTAGLLWLAVVLAGGLAVLNNSGQLRQSSQGLLSLSNLPWLYLSMTVLKLLHETAHAFVVKRYGGQVLTVGLMFLIFTPMPYVDASATWGIQSKWKRACVGLAGVAAELFVAALAALVWAHTGDGPVNSLAFNVMVIGSVSALLFNGNPLLRFDAYYVLSDLVELPNLYQKGQQQCLAWCQRVLMGQAEAASPAVDAYEGRWFTAYGWASFGYRLLLSVSILAFVLDQWFALGLLMMASTVLTLLVLPGRRFAAYLLGPALQGRRGRAVGALAGAVLLLYGVVVWLPLPHAVRVPGVLEAEHRSPIYLRAGGTLAELPVQHGQRVQAGQLLMVLHNPDLELEIRNTRLQRQELELLQRQTWQNFQRGSADTAPLAARLAALDSRLRELLEQQSRLRVLAPQAGEWVSPAVHERLAAWIERGQLVGEVVDRSAYRFSAVLSQDEAAELFPAQQGGMLTSLAGGELRLAGQAAHNIPLPSLGLLPYRRERLLSPVLGWLGGGDVPVRADDQTGTLAAEAYFEVRAALPQLAGAGNPVVAYPGMSGVLRVPLAGRTLYQGAKLALQQMVQRRYAQ